MTLRSKNVSMGLLGIFGISVSFADCRCFSFFVSGRPSPSPSRRLSRGGMPSQSSLRDASSPKGGATGVPVRPTRDEQSFFYPETVVPCGLDSQQLDKALLFRSRCPRKRGPLFCALSGLRHPAKSGPARQWLPLWGNGDDRRQWRKQGGAVGAAASRMQATA